MAVCGVGRDRDVIVGTIVLVGDRVLVVVVGVVES